MSVYENVFDTISEMTKANSPKQEGDYEQDGLLFCGKCHTAKQVRINFLGVEKKPYCICKCEQEKREAEEKARQQVELERRIYRNKLNAFPDVKDDTAPEDDMRNWTFENDNGKQPELSAAAKRYVENFESFMKQGKGLLLYGSVGVGKSYIAGCIANAVLDKGYQVLMTTFDRIETTAFGMSSGKQEYFDSLNRIPLLILDDLGAERDTEYMQEIVYKVIDSRCRVNLPIIITSNLTSQELKSPENIMKQRIYSRLLKMCHPIHVKGDDQRKRKALESYAETKKILGI